MRDHFFLGAKRCLLNGGVGYFQLSLGRLFYAIFYLEIFFFSREWISYEKTARSPQCCLLPPHSLTEPLLFRDSKRVTTIN